jgi:hypothetical protein
MPPRPRLVPTSIEVLVASVLALAAVACRYSPEVPSGVQACGDRNACPSGLVCTETNRCCAPNDSDSRCKNSPRKPDAGQTTKVDPSDISLDAGTGAAADAPTARDDAAPDLAGGNTPDATTASSLKVKRLTTFPADLVTYWFDCNRSPGKKNDRWCTFVSGGELWVINLARAAKEFVRCDGTDPLCLRLTTKVYRDHEDFTSFANPTFWGDLLIFHAEAKTNVSLNYRGGVFAWMPGWPAARKLTSSDGLKCQGVEQNDKSWAPAVYCIDNATPSGQVDLLVTPDVATTPLALVTRLPPESPGAPAPLSGTAALAVDGNFLIYRSGSPGKRSLFRASTRPGPMPENPVLIIDDVKDWRLSVDGQDVYLLYPNGRLSWANIKDPAIKTDLALQVGTFEVQQSSSIGDNGVIALSEMTNRGGRLKLFFSRTSAAETDVGRTFEIGFDLSSDRRFTIFQPLWSTIGLGSVALMNNTTRESCTLQAKPRAEVFNTGSFSQNGNWASWLEYENETGEANIWIARTQNCTDHHMVGRDYSQFGFIDDWGFVFLDEWQRDRGSRFRIVQWGPGQTWPESGPATVFRSVDAFEFPRPGDTLIPFTSAEPGQEGLYVLELPR